MAYIHAKLCHAYNDDVMVNGALHSINFNLKSKYNPIKILLFSFNSIRHSKFKLVYNAIKY